MTLSKLRASIEGLLYQRIEGSVGSDKVKRKEFGGFGNKFNAGIQMEDFCKAGGSEALFFKRLTQSHLIALSLDLHAQFIAFEGEAGGNGVMQLPLILLRNIQRFVDNPCEVPSVRQIVVAESGGEGGVLSLGIQGEVGGVHLLFGGETLIDSVAQIQLGVEGSADIVVLFVSIEDGSPNVLDAALVPAITDARGKPGEKLFEGGVAIGARFGEA